MPYRKTCSLRSGRRAHRFSFFNDFDRDENNIANLQVTFQVADFFGVVDDLADIAAVSLSIHDVSNEMPEGVAISSGNLDHVAVYRLRMGVFPHLPYTAGQS